MPVTHRMRLMEMAATLGKVLTHDVMDNVMEHLSLNDCLSISGISKEMFDSDVVRRRLWARTRACT